MAFEKIKLATGEFRTDYIARRLGEGASPKDVLAEINAPGLYSGPEGKSWSEQVVYAVKRTLAQAAEPADEELRPASKQKAAVLVSAVPAEYEGILDPEDMAEIEKTARDELRAEQRKQARKDLIARAKADLRREAARLAQQGDPRGDNLDITIDLAPTQRSGKNLEAPCIKLDGVAYDHGRTYRVPRKVYAVLMEQMQRGWQHEGSLHGNNENFYRQHQPKRVTPNGVVPVQGLRV